MILLKLGGSLITDKNQRERFREEEMRRIADEISRARRHLPQQELIVGHGSGSFGHFEAKQHKTADGVYSQEDWHGFARVSVVASRLNQLVVECLLESGLSVMRFQPSASALSADAKITSMSLENIQQAISKGITPVVHGDVSFDTLRGGTIISTETVFAYIAQQLPIERIILVGEVDGVLDKAENVIDVITPETRPALEGVLRGSQGVDVTGGMRTKVDDMLALVVRQPFPVVRIINGLVPDRIYRELINEPGIGTTLHRD